MAPLSIEAQKTLVILRTCNNKLKFLRDTIGEPRSGGSDKMVYFFLSIFDFVLLDVVIRFMLNTYGLIYTPCDIPISIKV